MESRKTIERTNKTKRKVFLKKIQQNWQTFSSTKRKKEKMQVTKIRNKNEDLTEIKRIIREYYEWLRKNKLYI